MIRIGGLYLPRAKWLLLCGDVGLLGATFFVSCWIRYGFQEGWLYARASMGSLAAIALFYLLHLYVADFYSLTEVYQRWQKLLHAYMLGGVVTILASSSFYFIWQLRLSRAVMLIQLFLVPAIVISWRVAFYHLQQSRKAIMLARPVEAKRILDLLQGQRYSEYRVVTMCGSLEELREELESNEERGRYDVLIYSIEYLQHNESLEFLTMQQGAGLEVWSLPEIYEWLSGKVLCESYAPPMLVTQLMEGKRIYDQRLKRMVDIGCSLLLLGFMFPLLFLFCLLIKLDSRGPIFYRQLRVGMHERVFDLLKFRTMSVLETGQAITYAKENDTRITRLGRWLRRYHIDEIPQLVNVLKGEMGFIGPRPEIARYVGEWNSEIQYYPLRTLIPQGITGWAQVNYPYPNNAEQKREALCFDLYYVKHFSLLMDLRVLLRTIRVVLFRHGVSTYM